MKEFPFKLFAKHALPESLIAISSTLLGTYNILGYVDWQERYQDAPFEPVLYMFGIWPFVAMLFAAVGFGLLARAKVRRKCRNRT